MARLIHIGQCTFLYFKEHIFTLNFNQWVEELVRPPILAFAVAPINTINKQQGKGAPPLHNFYLNH